MPDLHNGLREYSSLLRGVARAVGEQAGAQDFQGIERLGETLTPMLNPWDLRVTPEWALIRGQNLFARAQSVAALAGNFSALELVNPVGSTVLAVVHRIVNAGTQICETQIDTGGALGAVATTRGIFLDGRSPQLGAVSVCTLVSGQFAAGANLPQDRIGINGLASEVPYILPPGRKLFLFGTVLNTAFSAAVFFSERSLLTNESLP